MNKYVEETDIEPFIENIDKVMERMAKGARSGPYEPTWESLAKHNEAPDWFRDGKIGIYFHWGLYSVPAYRKEWYLQSMHKVGHKQARPSTWRYHLDKYGELDEFGYHHFAPMFTAEHFDAEEWLDLFAKAGARWVGPCAEHHDGYSLWDSELTPWNTMDTGPMRDIVGELEKATRKRDLKYIMTMHHERSFAWSPRAEGSFNDTDNPVLQFMYFNDFDKTLFQKIFQAKLGEVIDKYKPDLLWFDGQMQQIEDSYHQEFAAYYLNQAEKWGKEVMITTKKLQYPQDLAVLDFERGRATAKTPYPWLNDDTVTTGVSWSYEQSLKYKTDTQILHDFIDAVSKNGQLLLSIAPRPDGTIPEEQRQVLLGIGEWLDVNGEAIYNTRPWLHSGEGPTWLAKAGSYSGRKDYTPEDIRYTRSKDNKNLYAVLLGWPEDGISSPSTLQFNSDKGKVELLGHGPVDYVIKDGRVTVTLPSEKPCDHAYSLKFTGFDVSVTLTPEQAENLKDREKQLDKVMEKYRKMHAKAERGPRIG